MLSLTFVHRCKLCRKRFSTKRTAQDFCCPEHQTEFKKLRTLQGRRIIELAIASRLRRGSKEEVARASKARRDLYAELDRICGEERERIADPDKWIERNAKPAPEPEPLSDDAPVSIWSIAKGN